MILDPRAGGSAAAGRPCLVVNPRSFRAARGDLARRAESLARHHGVDVLRCEDLAGFHATLDALRARQQERVFVLAGDGTAHAFAEYLSELPRGDWSPQVLFLAGGRANVVPRHCGGYPALPALSRALQAAATGEGLRIEPLPLLRVEQAGRAPRHGFLFAAAMIDTGIRICAAHRAAGSSWLHRSWIADPYSLLRVLAQVATGNSPLPPYPDVQVACSDGERLHAPLRLLLASTLPMRDALYDPFAARGAGALRLTAIAATAERFWRRLPALIRGRYGAGMTAADGYLSGRCAHADVVGLDGYSMDGEPSATPPDVRLRIGTGVELRLLRV